MVCRKDVRYGMGGVGGKYALEVMGTVLEGAQGRGGKGPWGNGV